MEGAVLDEDVDGAYLAEDVEGAVLAEDVEGAVLDEDVDGAYLAEGVGGAALAEDMQDTEEAVLAVGVKETLGCKGVDGWEVALEYEAEEWGIGEGGVWTSGKKSGR